jgi:carboxyl-terminal processing protease
MKFNTSLIVLLFIAQLGLTQNDLDKDLSKLELFLKSLDQRYVDSVSTSEILEKGLRSMLKELDPHSVYFSPEQYAAANEPLKGEFKGIGIRYQVIADTLIVIQVLGNSPAFNGGLKIGDQLIAIGSDTLSGLKMKSKAMSERIKDPINNHKPFIVFRQDEQLLPVLDRGNVSVTSVPAYFMLTDKIGYIKLNRFSSKSLNEFRSALDNLESEGMEELILDLRGNSGGYLNVAIKIVDEFLEDRKLIVYTEGTHQNKKETFATSGGRFIAGDLVVLIDEKSASASEIVAGAIQDWDRGLIVGRRSYGKGLVQRTIEYEDGSAMRLTISRYYTPTGRSIQRSYADGVDAYRKDLAERKKHGEYYSQDSMQIDTNMLYYTPLRRKVYGGGGIVPDVFIAADTGKRNPIWGQLNRTNLHYLYALNYERNKSDLMQSKFPTIRDYSEKFEFSDEDLSGLDTMLRNRGLEYSVEDYISISSDLKNSMQGLVARFGYGYSEQYYYVQSKDKGVLKAIDIIETDYLSEIGLK